MFLVQADSASWTGLRCFLAASCSFTTAGIDYMGQPIIAHFENFWTDLRAQAAANAQIRINFWSQCCASSH